MGDSDSEFGVVDKEAAKQIPEIRNGNTAVFNRRGAKPLQDLDEEERFQLSFMLGVTMQGLEANWEDPQEPESSKNSCITDFLDQDFL